MNEVRDAVIFSNIQNSTEMYNANWRTFASVRLFCFGGICSITECLWSFVSDYRVKTSEIMLVTCVTKYIE